MTSRTDRPPVRARSGRRPLPPLIFLLLLALGAGAVWWNVFQDESNRRAQAAARCTAVAEAPPSLDPTTVSVRVLNASEIQGEAGRVAAALKERGFVVDEVANDSSGREVTGVGEVRHGPRGADPARFVAVHLPGAADHEDTRATAQVDLVIGPEFSQLAPPEEVAAALVPPSGAAAC